MESLTRRIGLVGTLLVALAACSSVTPLKTVVVDGCIVPPSPVGAKYQVQLKAAIDAVKSSGNIDSTFQSEAVKLFDVNHDLVQLYAVGTYCLMSKNLSEADKDKLRDRLNSIVAQVTASTSSGKASPLPPGAVSAPKTTPQDKAAVVLELRALTASVAAGLHLTEERLRANVFVPEKDGTLRIADGLYLRMFNEAELTIALPTRSGATGVAFSSQSLVMGFDATKKGYFSEGGALYPVVGWNQFTIPYDEAAKISPDLKWVFSAPLKTDAGQVIGVLTVDCTGQSCDQVTPEVLAAQAERYMRVSAAKIGTILQPHVKTASP